MAGNDWVLTSIGAETDLLTGFPFVSNRYVSDPTGIKLLRGDNVAQGDLRWDGAKYWSSDDLDELKQFYLQDGDVILAMDRPWIEAGLKYAAVTQHDLPCLLVQRVARLRGTTSLDTRYLKYLIGSLPFVQYVLAVQTGTAVPHISASQIKSFVFYRPLLSEQRAIACILGALDDKIELNRRMNRTLDAMARALFQSWFVDFDPVRAKVAGEQPAGLKPELAALFPDRLVESDLGEIPEGWEVVTLGNLGELEKGLSYKGEGLSEEDGIPMVNLGCFAGQGVFIAEKVKRYIGEYRDRHIVHAGDLVIANTDVTQNRIILGSPAILPKFGKESRYLFTHHVFAVRFFQEFEKWKYFVYFSLLKPEFREIAEGFATGTTVLALPRDGLLKYPFCLPSVSVLQVFERHIAQIRALIDCNLCQSRTLAALRDTLLPKLISGELRVADAERIVGRCL